jgi:methyltransferase (TIGR00027 family)
MIILVESSIRNYRCKTEQFIAIIPNVSNQSIQGEIMITAKSSVTAEIMAAHRATEMLRPPKERVCQDPFAIHFLSQEMVALLKDRQQLTALAKESAQKFPGINGAVVARVRFIDEIVLKYLEEGLIQIIILGAGYDSRAYRIEEIKGNITVFEVDNPDTQQIKIQKIVEILGEKPEHVKYVQIDFIRDDLKTCLLKNGYDPAKRTLFIMEGLTFYLPAETLDSILAFIATYSGLQSAVVFDYLPPSVINGTSDRPEGKNSWIEVQRSGEHFRFGLESGELAAFLAQRGFELKNNVNAPDCKNMYFRGQSLQRQISPIFWFAHAIVSNPQRKLRDD